MLHRLFNKKGYWYKPPQMKVN
jgi:hypothetical protein